MEGVETALTLSGDDGRSNPNSTPSTIPETAAFDAVATRPPQRPEGAAKHSSLFAPREGKHLIWRNVNMTLQQKDKEDKKILDNVWGEVPAHKTTAIMGSSGAGKSSLLNILAGRSQSRGKLKIETDVRLNNYKVDPSNIHVRKCIAFVSQDDSLQVTATPREAIEFSARLRLPRGTTDMELDHLVNNMLEELGLTSCADTIVGGALIKGISGGERKRTSVGVELVVRPAMVFLDEPTSGIDSHNAIRLCKVLKKVANAGSSVLFTIHQPASQIFASFDQLILLNKGRIMYQGPVADVPSYFAERGHPCPQHFNPADWVMHVAIENPIGQLDDQGFFPKDTRELGDPFFGTKGKDILGRTENSLSESEKGYNKHRQIDDRPVGFLVQTKYLFRREINNLFRDSNALQARIRFSVGMSLLIGCIFYEVASCSYADPSHLFSAFGGLLMAQLVVVFATVLPAVLIFPEERPVFLREYSTNHYSVLAYFLSRLAMEIWITAVQSLVSSLLTYYLIGFKTHFLTYFATLYTMAISGMALSAAIGCAIEDPKVAVEMLPVLVVPQILFAGFFVSADLIPMWLRWLRYLMPLTYAVRILLLDEFDGTCEIAFFCNDLINRVEADPEEVWWYWFVLIVLFVVVRIIALFVLRHQALRFY